MNQIVIIIAGILAIVIVALQVMQYLQGNKQSMTCPVIPPCPACPACQPCHPCPPCQLQQQRDRRVLSDPLYPPLNRSTDMMQEDSFRLIGYLSNPDQGSKKDDWKLFGRMKDRHQGEYYIIPVDNNLDLKIPLTQDVVVGERLRDIYNLPQEMKFKSPMLKSSTYIMTEIPKGEIGSSYF